MLWVRQRDIMFFFGGLGGIFPYLLFAFLNKHNRSIRDGKVQTPEMCMHRNSGQKLGEIERLRRPLDYHETEDCYLTNDIWGASGQASRSYLLRLSACQKSPETIPCQFRQMIQDPAAAGRSPRAHAKGVVLSEKACFCLLCAFSTASS